MDRRSHWFTVLYSAGWTVGILGVIGLSYLLFGR